MTQTSSLDKKNGTGFPLSFGQERLWLAYLLEPHSPSYNIAVCLRLQGKLDVRALEQSLVEIVCRHDILRTCIVVTDGEPRQRVMPFTTASIATLDLGDVPASDRWKRATEIASVEAERPFDLRKGPVFRASLIRTGEADHMFLFVVHHIAFDGWSRDILLRELSFFYERFVAGQTGVLPELPLTYADFAVWQRELVASDAVRDDLDYWREHVGQDPQVVDLPADYPRPKARSSVGRTSVFRISHSVAEGLKLLARAESTTLYVTLLAAFVALLHRYTGQDEIVIGTPVAGRTRLDLDGIMGFFVNTIPLRARTDNDPSFRELARHVRSVVIGGLEHQDIPLEKLTEELHLAHDLGRTPLFQLLFTFETFARAPEEMSGVQVEMIDIYTKTAKFDLTLTMRDVQNGLLAVWEYSSELFEEETIRRMSGHLNRLLAHVADHPETRLSELPLLGEEERQGIVVDWNSTDRDYPRESRIHEVFEDQADLDGRRVALVADNQRMTYAELNQCANQLARVLRKEGVTREAPVGLCLKRSIDMVVGMLGILKAGGVYIPLDADYPQERIRYILEDANASVVVTDSLLTSNVPRDGRRILCLDVDRDEIANESTDNLHVGGRSDDMAYLMYTSGSTGKPKGVCVVHRGVVRLVKGNYYASLGSDEVFLQLSPFSFDASTFEIWGSLLNGGRLVIAPNQLPNHDELGRILSNEHVSTLWLTAGLFHNVVDVGLEALSGLKQLLVGGDVVSPAHATRFKARYPDCRLINGYGPTENTTFTTCYEISGGEAGSLPIGLPIANTSVYILDAHLRPVPIGVVGELCIGGDGLARGYLNDEKLTGERFVSNSVAPLDSPVLYRSGDMAKYRPDGVITFEGRRDNQVKVSGYRVETEEVEAVLRACPGVAQVTVVARPSPRGDKQLVAYCVPGPATELTGVSLRSYMQERVPRYMVPSSFVILPEFQLNAQGKVDRHALPEPGPREATEIASHAAPRDPLELMITSIWKELFAADSVGINDNFFDLGGHSLLAFRFFAALEKSTGVALPLATLFEAPTIEQLATIIRNKGWRPAWSCLVPIKPGGSRLPIFFVHGVGGNVLNFYDLARSLNSDQPVFGLQSRGLDGKERPLTRVEDMAELYINEIMTLQPHGPYALGGLSFGGMVAFEMARQLVDQGETVAVLALLDTFLLAESRMSISAIKGRLDSLGARIGAHTRSLLTLPPHEKLEYMRRSNKTLKRKVRSLYWRMTLDEDRPVIGSISDAQRNVKESNFLAAREYEARPYPGRATLFLAGDRGIAGITDPVEHWNSLAAGGVETITVPGTHVTMVSEPHVGVLAQRLEQRLSQACREVPAVTTRAPR